MSTSTVRICLLLLLAVAGSVNATPATTTAVTQPTAANLEVSEWAVFVVDASTGQMNPQGLVTSTLPPFVADHRFNYSATDTAPPVNNLNNGLVFNGRFWMRLNVPPASPTAPPPPADSDLPSPGGVIRLIGSAESKVDVSLTANGGSFLGSWPKAEDRDKQILWRDLSVAGHTDDQAPLVGPNHWFTELRSVKSAYLSMVHGGNDRFLLYDLEMPYPTPLQAKAGKDFSFQIINPTSAPLHDLVIYQGDGPGWRAAIIGELAATKPPLPAAATTQSASALKKGRLGVVVADVSKNLSLAKNYGYQGSTGLMVLRVDPGSPAERQLKNSDIIVEVNGKEAKTSGDLTSQTDGSSVKLKVFRAGNTIEITIALPPPASQPATPPAFVATQPTTRTIAAATKQSVLATKPSVSATQALAAATQPVEKSYQLASVSSTQPSDLAETWKPLMKGAGVDPTDAAVMTRVIARYAFDPHRLTAVYRMDDAELDRILPIEIVPQPSRIRRFALVIVINVNPAAGTIIDDLIKQLGDDDWNKRQSAYEALAAMGPAAQAKLTGAKGNGDLEIAWRAEKLLSLIPAAGK